MLDLSNPYRWYDTPGSSNIDSFRYDELNFALYVKFVNGSQYAYANVGPEIVEGWLKASSKGSYHYHKIRLSFPYVRIG